jgi:hypothetical protein
MTDVDSSTGTLVDFFVMFIVFWTVFIAFFVVWVLYIWPSVEDLYEYLRNKLYWYLREFCRKDGYDGYKMHNNRKGWRS